MRKGSEVETKRFQALKTISKQFILETRGSSRHSDLSLSIEWYSAGQIWNDYTGFVGASSTDLHSGQE